MKRKVIEKSKISALVKDLTREHDVFTPLKQRGFVSFERVFSGKEACLEFQNAKKPPKEIFFPQTEILFTYKVNKNGVETTESPTIERKMVLLAVRPCDARSFVMVDQFFSSEEIRDKYYSQKKENTAIVGLACNHPSSTCFCTSVGGSPFGKEGMDLLLSDLGDKYLMEALSEKGENLIEKSPLLEDAQMADRDKAMELSKNAQKAIRSRVSVEGLSKKLDEMFEDPVWDQIREKCVNCGVCTYLCPTCCCFDILDEETDNGKRVRIWDSCQFPLFTAQGSGHNPRPSGKEMMRQRIMHKFNYHVDNFGENFCVGCGRCIRECPVSLDIREIIEKIYSVETK
jgi:sulfhydrogenase subunit beta (sulfur reductase)